MAVEIKVPSVGESITEVVISNWIKGEGQAVGRDEAVVEIESDKATVEVPAPVAGTVSKVLKQAGESAEVGEVIAYVEEGAAAADTSRAAVSDKVESTNGAPQGDGKQPTAGSKNAASEDAAPASTRSHVDTQQGKTVMPSAQRVIAERGLDASAVAGSGPGGRVLKEDAMRAPATRTADGANAGQRPAPQPAGDFGEFEEIVPMTPIRRRIAERLVESQQTAALLTTFNEIDMSNVMALRKQYQERFQERYQIKLGFMSFFVKAAIDALKQFPAVNSEIRWPNVVYKNHYDIGIAIGGGKGLLVPVVRNADRMSFAEVELAIDDFGKRAVANKIDLEELQGGTFTISNGGVYGSLMSTPIVNPPQVAILGLHAIQERPVVRDGQIVIRPMMYVAVTYDHRIIDGRESVSFLKRIKENMEDPSRMLLEV
jgi:2-oxoglutarate dehydrogenase E2 component (dihydrolipoamide succinyltransferase)